MISYKSVVLDASKDQFNKIIAIFQILSGGDNLADIIWNKKREDHQK